MAKAAKLGGASGLGGYTGDQIDLWKSLVLEAKEGSLSALTAEVYVISACGETVTRNLVPLEDINPEDF